MLDRARLEQYIHELQERGVRVWHVALAAVVLGLVTTVFVLYFYARPPAAFPTNAPVTIEPGLTAAAIAQLLEEERVVRSSLGLYLTIILFHDPLEVKAGSYVFHEPHGLFAIARQITDDNPPIEQVSLTFYEGSTIARYADTAEQYLPEFDRTRFIELAQSYEGFLFPDTYYVPYSFTAEELFALLSETYQQQVTEVLRRNTTELSEYEIITLASLIEREANSETSMRTVAGILLNRLELGMALQLDASMEYVIDKPLDELTPEDLQVESPYNTYLNAGLPPTPIGNPGLASIEAVLDPIESDYLYYITGTDGNFYYAESYEEHLENIEQYLR